MKIDRLKITKAIRSSIPLTIRSFYLNIEIENEIETTLSLFLRELNQEILKDSLYYCIRELYMNAYKANMKRLFFIARGLNIHNKIDYEKGMKDFKNEMISNLQYYQDIQEESGLYIKIIFHVLNNNFYLYVVNNSEMTVFEQKRIYDRIAQSHSFKNIEEALTTTIDNTEGAGLGLTIITLMLKKIGISENEFEIESDSGETIVKITIPTDQEYLNNIQYVSEKIIKELDKIPSFPDNITALQSEINNKDASIAKIAQKISSDPALASELLKTANSASFMFPKRIDNVLEAVKLIGFRALKNILYSYGAQSILPVNSKGAKELWNHSQRTAFYAYLLTRKVLKRNDILDEVYVGAILHDIGKIILSLTHSKTIKDIQELVSRKNISMPLIESFLTGLNHAEIGAKLAEKWNFPESLIQIIRYHHKPQEADPKYHILSFVVYIANSLANIDTSLIDYEQINPNIYMAMKIPSIENLKKIHESLLKNYSEKHELQ